MKQLLTPTPDIPCVPGWCLQYVRQTFGIETPAYDTATDGWNAAKFKHRDMNFPAGVAVPLWFAMAGEPRGHVVLRLADGSIFSTTNPKPAGYWPRRHPNLADLMAVYAAAGAPLTYLGWTEDIENVPVVASTPVITLKGSEMELTPEQFSNLVTAAVRTVVRTELQFATKDGEFGKNERGGLYELAQDVKDIKRTLTPGEFGKRLPGEAIAAVDEIAKKAAAAATPAT